MSLGGVPLTSPSPHEGSHDLPCYPNPCPATSAGRLCVPVELTKSTDLEQNRVMPLVAWRCGSATARCGRDGCGATLDQPLSL